MVITKNMTIEEVLALDPIIEGILMKSGMHCIGCGSAKGETLEEAAAVHGIDVDVLVDQMNDFLNI